jgi:hypothetical protein
VSRVIWAAFMLCIGSCIVSAQREPLTNSDVVAMFRFGLSEQTIVRSVQQGRTAFDISPDALIKMKRVGLSDNVVNAMLRSAYHLDGGHRKSPSAAEETVSNQSKSPSFSAGLQVTSTSGSGQRQPATAPSAP